MAWDDDALAGKAALVYFHEEALNFPDNYKIATIDDLLEAMRQQYYPGLPDLSIFCEGLGLAIRTSGVSDSQVHDAMTSLADQGQGKLPTNQNMFFGAIANQGENPSFLATATAVASMSAQQIAQGAQAVGQTALNVGKSALSVANIFGNPVVLAGGLAAVVAFVLYLRFGKHRAP